MRFIAVFYQQRTIYGMGFEMAVDASDFLFCGYADNDLIPCGIYDMMTDKVTLYEHMDEPLDYSDSEPIRQFAINYIKQIRQYVALHDR